MITVKLTGGLGNQLFQYSTGRALAYRNNTEVCLDISGFESDNFRKFALGPFDLRCKIIGTIKKPRFAWLSRVSFRHDKLNSFRHFDPVWKFDESLQQNTAKHINLSGYYSWIQYFQDIDSVIRNDLKLKIPLNHSCPHWVVQAKKAPTVSIHIRRTDYTLSNNEQLFGLLSIDYYCNAINHLKERMDNPFFLIFSDDLSWAKEIFIRQVNIENYSLVSDPCLIEPAQELILMSYCNHNIIANSTFSWWGAWLNEDPEKIVIQPRKWYNDERAQSVYESGAFQIPGAIKL